MTSLICPGIRSLGVKRIPPNIVLLFDFPSVEDEVQVTIASNLILYYNFGWKLGTLESNIF